ncbi:type II secretion system protein [Deinococcus cellulosilyticus]|uniref:Prepilin-type N-terminal cleavage/methylation domain-containing protein n=1 Tax=Deinococcus cellulosilyticus (strain DSM 18568 / NBRC 106333 / KACC 11606 / 5516J-15) TaxID=1223518 RepID=A0A511N9U4_DEIC1|nr:type II secretion system protein [Deinococcus cellulosilyticus]GEM49604.1 hypothetical protein DC3_52390 [Deinococcus cellulosilyticus NBRC 106333 = KACC 11606]
MQQRRSGFTLLEILIALGIVGVLLTLLMKFTVSVNGTSQDLQDRITVTDATRRLSELVTQELRSTAFGVVASQPYAPASNQISVLRPVPGSGNAVVGIGVVPATGFETSTSITTFTGNLASVPAGTYMVLLSGPAARLLRTTAATTAGTTQVFSHGSCQNVLGATSATVSLVTPIGYRYDAAGRVLYEKRGSSAETIMAWNVSQFSLAYTYVNTSTSAETTSSTFSGITTGSGSFQSVLRRITLTVGMEEDGKSQVLTNTINLTSPIGLNITNYTECTT